MKVAFFVNDVATEESEFTTTRLAIATAKLEHEVWYVGVGDVDGGVVEAGLRRAGSMTCSSSSSAVR